MKNLILISLMGVLLAACSPRDAFNKVIEDKNFIPYELPMESTRVGTILRGNNEELYLVAKPETCFPDLGGNKSLRWVQPTDLPNEYKHLELGFDIGLSPMFGVGNAIINLKFGASYVKTMSLDFKNPSVEFLDESAFFDYYKGSMNKSCQGLLAQHAFIGQGLRVESMSFVFKDSHGFAINLGGLLGSIVSVAPGVSWKIENEYTLTITTPKYIGYRMAQLDGDKLVYASTVNSHGEWIFHDPDQSASAASAVDLSWSQQKTQNRSSVRVAEPL